MVYGKKLWTMLVALLEMNGDFSKSFPIVTNKFICNVKDFHNNIHLDKMVQALRNVWIMK